MARLGVVAFGDVELAVRAEVQSAAVVVAGAAESGSVSSTNSLAGLIVLPIIVKRLTRCSPPVACV